MTVRKLTTSFAIGGQELPVKSWSVRLGADGQIGTVNATTSLAFLRDSGIDVIGWSEDPDGASIDVYAGYDGSIEHIFGGVLDDAEYDPVADTFEISGRDLGAILADSTAVPSSINYKNATISDIAQQIADINGFDTNITQTDLKPATELWGTSAFIPNSQTWWSVLQNLAQQVGYDLSVSPDGTLNFGPPQDSSSSHDVILAPNRARAKQGTVTPLITCKFKFNPRNNTNFDVKVISYHPQQAQKTSGHARPSLKLKGRKASPLIASTVGTSGKKVRKASRAGTTPKQKPTYIYQMDGLSNDRAQAKAQAIADDIAKRAIIFTGEIEGDASLKVHSSIKLTQGQIDLLGFDSLQYQLASVTQRFEMPQRGSKSGGWVTQFEAWAAI